LKLLAITTQQLPLVLKKSKLILVGAGPGNPELITLKGVKAIQQADAILYDALVNEELLKYAKQDIPLVFVGKRKGIHSFTQEQINELIVEHAQKYGTVVRLKGGDPFVFGRGFEEILHAQQFNIEIEYIPGISSAIGVLGLHSMPVTHRGSSESFWVITGTTSSKEISGDIRLAVKSTATVVILMGLTKLQEIVNIYIENGEQKKPIAIIQKGSLPNENIAIGTIETIVDIANKKNIAPPAIIVIGNVVKLNKSWE
jgi:uroporphyrin-III C-methyltransferase